MNVPLARNSICLLHEIIVRRDKRGMAITPKNTFKNLAKILKRVLRMCSFIQGKEGVCILLRAPMLERTIDYCHNEALRHHTGYKSCHNGVPHSIHKTGFRGF